MAEEGAQLGRLEQSPAREHQDQLPRVVGACIRVLVCRWVTPVDAAPKDPDPKVDTNRAEHDKHGCMAAWLRPSAK